MDFAVVAIFGVIMIGGFAFGMLLTVVRPSDAEAAAAHRQLARRALAWLPDRSPSNPVRVQPEVDSGFHG